MEYKREILYKDDKCELVLITWPPGSQSVPHDHGISQGYIYVVSGKVKQHIYDKTTKKKISVAYNYAGETFSEPQNIIHIMENGSETEEAITIHMYTPPVNMSQYPKDILIC